MAVLVDVVGRAIGTESTAIILAALAVGFVVLAIVLNIVKQVAFKDSSKPPVVFHWLPFIGNAVPFGQDPIKFYRECREKHGDLFTFVLLGQNLTVYLGTEGNDFILNGKLSDVSAEDIYGPLTAPVFGPGVVYDCPNSKLMEQKRFVKYGLTTEALTSYVPIITKETRDFFKTHPSFAGKQSGLFDVISATAELTILTASHCLQGPEVRAGMSGRIAQLFAALDKGFSPLNFVIPHVPIEQNRNRDSAHHELVEFYLGIVKKRREGLANGTMKRYSDDMIWELMDCSYKKHGGQIPDREIACMMIALLMAGQHSSASTISWILLRLADDAHEDKDVYLADELIAEQRRVLGHDLRDPTYEDLDRLPLHSWFVRETLRLHAPIHSVMRKVKTPMTAFGKYRIPKGHVLVSALGFPSRMAEYFPDPEKWDPHRWDPASPLYSVDAAAMEAASEQEVSVNYGYGDVKKGTRSPYIPFGAGRHRCIGEKFAFVQLRTILIEVVRSIAIKNGSGKYGIVGTDYSSLFSHPLHAEIAFTRRTNLSVSSTSTVQSEKQTVNAELNKENVRSSA